MALSTQNSSKRWMVIGGILLATATFLTPPPFLAPLSQVRLAEAQSRDTLTVMEVAFKGDYIRGQIKKCLDRAMTLYRVLISEENYSRAASSLVALRKETGVPEMDILAYMIRSHVPGVNLNFPEAAALGAVVVSISTPAQHVAASPQTARTLPDEPHCQMTASGWSCILATEEEFRSLQDGTERFDALNKHLKQSCETQGGRWRCYGFCLPFYTRYCDFRFDDAGKLCIDSTQCNSRCVTDDPKCQENCSGTCAEYALRSCDAFIEVVHGRTNPNFVVCD